jgi:(E)-4-hydroxy-3-methylbut-2-enyl-diphosphate synthase
LLKQIEDYTNSINKQITIAIMGCSVNGIGECEHADVGLFGSKEKLFIYKNGKQIKIVFIKNGFNELKKIIDSL